MSGSACPIERWHCSCRLTLGVWGPPAFIFSCHSRIPCQMIFLSFIWFGGPCWAGMLACGTWSIGGCENTGWLGALVTIATMWHIAYMEMNRSVWVKDVWNEKLKHTKKNCPSKTNLCFCSACHLIVASCSKKTYKVMYNLHGVLKSYVNCILNMMYLKYIYIVWYTCTWCSPILPVHAHLIFKIMLQKIHIHVFQDKTCMYSNDIVYKS